MTCCQRKEILLKCLFQEWRLCTGEEGIRRRYGEDKLIATSFETRMGRRNFGTKQFRRGSLSPVPRAHIISKVRSCSPSLPYQRMHSRSFIKRAPSSKCSSRRKLVRTGHDSGSLPKQGPCYFRPVFLSPVGLCLDSSSLHTAGVGRGKGGLYAMYGRVPAGTWCGVCACEKRGASVAGVAGLCLAPPERVCSGSD